MDMLETSVYKTNRFDVDCNILWTKAYHYESDGKKKLQAHRNTEQDSEKKRDKTYQMKWDSAK